jgi:transcriptional regulator NrdR family protein
MKCPICGAWTSVLETRTRKRDGVVVRRYECGNEHRFTTNERVLMNDIHPSLQSPTMFLQQSAVLGDNHV